jgi:hypothetical protein
MTIMRELTTLLEKQRKLMDDWFKKVDEYNVMPPSGRREEAIDEIQAIQREINGVAARIMEQAKV